MSNLIFTIPCTCSSKLYEVLNKFCLMIIRTQTTLKEGVQLPPPDYLMCKLIEMVNIENPPCANCDKRDFSSMHFCSTCGKCTCMTWTMGFYNVKKRLRSSSVQILPRKHSSCQNVFFARYSANVQTVDRQNGNSKTDKSHDKTNHSGVISDF